MMTLEMTTTTDHQPPRLAACLGRAYALLGVPLLVELLAYLVRPEVYPAYLPLSGKLILFPLTFFYFAVLFGIPSVPLALVIRRVGFRAETAVPPLFFGLFLALTLSRLLPRDSGLSPARLGVFAISLALVVIFYSILRVRRPSLSRLVICTSVYAGISAYSLAMLFQFPLSGVWSALLLHSLFFAALFIPPGKWSAGLLVFVLVLFFPGRSRLPQPAAVSFANPMPAYQRVIVIGMDALSPDVLSELVSQGKLPAFSRMMAGGASGRLQTVAVPFSPVVWNSIYTGTLPRQHGIMGFTFTRVLGAPPFISLWLDNWSNSDWMHLAVRALEAGRILRTGAPARSRDRLKPAVWNMLQQNGASSVVVGGWTSYPPERILGSFVSEYAFTAGAKERIGSYCPANPQAEQVLAQDPNVDAWPAEIRRYISRDMKVHSLSSALFQSGSADARFLFAYYSAADAYGHHYGTRIGMKKTSVGEVRQLTAMRAAVYAQLDSYMQTYLSMLEDGRTLLIVCSDHGFRFDKRLHNYPVDGVFLAVGKGVRKVGITGANVYSIAPTVMYALGMPPERDFREAPLKEIFERPISQPPPRDYQRNRSFFDTSSDSRFQQDNMKELQDLGYVNR